MAGRAPTRPPPRAEEPPRWLEAQGGRRRGPAAASCLRWRRAPGQVTSRPRASPGRQGDDAYPRRVMGAFLAVWALVSAASSRLFCILLHVGRPPAPRMSEGPVCLQGLGQWLACAPLSASPPHPVTVPSLRLALLGTVLRDVRGRGRSLTSGGSREGSPEKGPLS